MPSRLRLPGAFMVKSGSLEEKFYELPTGMADRALLIEGVDNKLVGANLRIEVVLPIGVLETGPEGIEVPVPCPDVLTPSVIA